MRPYCRRTMPGTTARQHRNCDLRLDMLFEHIIRTEFWSAWSIPTTSSNSFFSGLMEAA
jgi:hypothetical protein